MKSCGNCFYCDGISRMTANGIDTYKCIYPQNVNFNSRTRKRGWYGTFLKRDTCLNWKQKFIIKLPTVDESDLDNLFLCLNYVIVIERER